MALCFSRTRIGGVLKHQELAIRLASSSRVASCVHSGITLPQTYSTASASLTKKRPVTAKGTRKDAHLNPPPPKEKAAIRHPPKKSTSPEMEVAHQVADPIPVAEVPVKSSPTSAQELSEEDKLKEMERMMAFQHLMPTIDAWGQEVKETLDVMIPRPVDYKNPSEAFKALKENFINSVKNTSALSSLVNENALPGIYHGLGFRQRMRQIFQVFRTQSVEADSLMTPVREMALDIYGDLNKAIANRVDKDVRKYTTAAYLTQSLQLAKTFRTKVPPKGRIIWQMHRTITPVQVLSLRVIEGYLAPEPPKLGNRLMVHALIKFDTEQSLEMYDASGNPLHSVVTDPDRIVDSEKPKESWRVPAPRKRVTEYLIMEKRMWHQGPWQFREQMWP